MKKLFGILVLIASFSTASFGQQTYKLKARGLDQDFDLCVDDGGVEKCPLTVDGPTGNLSVTGIVASSLHVQTGVSGATASASANDFIVEHSDAFGGMSILSTDTSDGHIMFGNNQSAIVGSIVFDHAAGGSGTDGTMQFRTGGNTVQMIIDKDGKIGMGTGVATPSSQVHIKIASAGAAAMRVENSEGFAIFQTDANNAQVVSGSGSVFLQTDSASNNTNLRHSGVAVVFELYWSKIVNFLAVRLIDVLDVMFVTL